MTVTGQIRESNLLLGSRGGKNDADVYLLEQRGGMTSGSSVNLIPASGQVKIPGAFRILTPHSCRLKKNVLNRVSSTLANDQGILLQTDLGLHCNVPEPPYYQGIFIS